MALTTADVLDYLQITWDDPVLKRKIEGAIARGKALIDDYAGAAQDYDAAGTPQALLLDYCRYVRSDATEDFEKNYIRDLVRLRLKAQTAILAETDADQNGGESS